MKSFIIKLLLLCLVFTSASKCGGGNEPPTTMIGYEMALNSIQLDSLLTVDEIDSDFDNWIKVSLIDYETGTAFVKYTYIKEITDSTELVYVLTPVDSLYNVIKRIVKPDEE